jgi:hypothetical protein
LRLKAFNKQNIYVFIADGLRGADTLARAFGGVMPGPGCSCCLVDEAFDALPLSASGRRRMRRHRRCSIGLFRLS